MIVEQDFLRRILPFGTNSEQEFLVAHNTTPVKDKQWITPAGKLVKEWISGVVLNRRPAIEDARGELVEVYNPAWNLHPDPMVYVYQASVRPGKVKGWVVHHKQDDRLYTMVGVLRWVLFDNRPESPSYKMINDITVSEHNRALLIVPKGVFHAVKNIGTSDAYFINMPTKAYDHTDPDKHRLPVKNDLIPFDFDDESKW